MSGSGLPTQVSAKWPIRTFPLLIAATTLAYASGWMGSYTCKSCKAPLPERRARCRVCGWALDYDPKTSRRERAVILGVSIMVVCIVFLALAVVIAVRYVKPLLGLAP